MAYLVHYGTLRTGADISVLPAETCTFGDELRGYGTFNAKVGPGQCGNGALLQATRGASTFWALEWADLGGRRIVAGGPIFARHLGDDGISYSGSNMFGMLAHRKLIDPAWTDAQISANSVTYSTLDLGSIMRNIVALTTTTAPGDLPIILEATRTGTNTRTYNGFDLAWASDRITELGNVEAGTAGMGGPDWLFTPRFKGGNTMSVDFTHIEWLFTTGTAAAPTLTSSSTIVLDRGAPGQQHVGPVTIAEDAAQLATHAFNLGGGTDKARVIASTVDPFLTALGYPRMDAANMSDSLDYATVKNYSAGLSTRKRRTPSGVTVSVDAGWWWGQSASVGAAVRLLIPSHPVFGPVDLTSRVAKWTADVNSTWVDLTLVDSLAEV